MITNVKRKIMNLLCTNNHKIVQNASAQSFLQDKVNIEYC